MRIYTTKCWDFHTYSEKAKAKCSVCGRTIYKSISCDYREDSYPDYEFVKEAKAKWESEPHVCHKCKLAQIVKDSNDLTGSFNEESKDLIVMKKEIDEINSKMEVIRKKLVDKYKGKVARDKDGNEFLIDTVCVYLDSNSAFSLVAYPINKSKPWLYKYDKSYYIKPGEHKYNNDISLDNVTITDEVFEERYKKVKDFVEDNK